MGILKRFVERLPGGRTVAERLSYVRRSRKLERIGDTEARFTHIFEKNKWKDAESRSGAGSSLATTSKLRAALPDLFERLDIEHVLDAPCGDYHWFRHVERPGVVYTGGDIVKPLIEANAERYSDDRTRFIALDIIRDPLPAADLWLSRDCLIHLSFEDIGRVLDNFRSNDIEYWLLTTHRNVDRNIDIPTGHCRMLNLKLPPFNFPAPLEYVADDDVENTGKCMGLWPRSRL